MTSLPLRKYGKSAAMAAASYVSVDPLFLFDYLLRFLRVAILLSLWRTILEGKGAVSGMTLGAVLTYTLISEVFAEQLSARAGIEEAFWNGTIANRYLQPLGLVEQFAAEMAGRWGVSLFLFSLPLLLASPLFGVNPCPASVNAGVLFTLSLVFAISVSLALDFIFATLMIYLDISIWVLSGLRNAVGTLLSGAMIPLALLPWGLGRVFEWLPFASMASAPLKIYTGTGNPYLLLTLQVVWSVLLWPLALALWRANRERVTSYGG